jgi:hypothetical protein
MPDSRHHILQTHWDILDFASIAQQHLGAAYDTLAPEELYRLQYKTLSMLDEHAADDALASQAEAVFIEQIETYKQQHIQATDAKSRRAALDEYMQHTFLPRWHRESQQWLDTLTQAARELQLPLPTQERVTRAFSAQLTRWQGQARKQLRDDDGAQPTEYTIQSIEQLFATAQVQYDTHLAELHGEASFRKAYQDKTDYAHYFPLARSIKRQILFFCGPTNSGKTHAAFEELAQAESGIYLAPLRLLALEGQQKLLDRGIPTTFLTGEERDERKGARFVSSTIEMLNPQKTTGCAIIDEIQLLAHPQRGWAWTNALLGVPAYKVILAGSPNALPIVQSIAEALHEPIEVRTFERLNQLHVQSTPASFETLAPHSAIICFSRRDVLELKHQVETQTAHRAAVIYGALSPAVRRAEAARFQSGEASILIATDAIGMGLNLPIHTVLFWTLDKTGATTKRPLTTDEIKQIAGRAGRFGFGEAGLVGAFQQADLDRVKQALADDLPLLQGPLHASPHPQHLSMLSEAYQTEDLPTLFQRFEADVWFPNGLFHTHITDTTRLLSETLAEPMHTCSLQDKYAFARAPIPRNDEALLAWLQELATAFASHTPSPLPESLASSLASLSSLALRDAEQAVRQLTLYCWLAYRYPALFPDRQHAERQRSQYNQHIEQLLHQPPSTNE